MANLFAKIQSVAASNYPFRAMLLLTALILVPTGVFYALATYSVSATVETVALAGDHDDPAIWIHPSNPAKSLMIGTSKDSGLAVYNVDGSLVQFVTQDGGMNNVDLRYNFPLADGKVDLVVATNRFDAINTLAMYKVNPGTRKLENITADPPIASDIDEVYGTCMYLSPHSGKQYAFITGEEGDVEQWELFDNGSGKVTGTLRRTFEIGTAAEGCVADDIYAYFYISEEKAGIWKYGAEPGDGTARTAVDSVGPAGHLTADIEGLTIYYTSAYTGYLIASSQGASEYVIYERLSPNNYVSTFEIVANNGIDGASNSDGIDVTNVSLGALFPQGVFVVHDKADEGGNNNFKLVPWQDIASGPAPPLTIDTSWDPRQVGLRTVAQFSAAVTIGPAPLKVNFTNLSSGGFDACLWLFGDGGSSNSCGNPTHIYAADGKYDVLLAVSGAGGGDTVQQQDYIWVGDYKILYLPLAINQ